jgi:hypothetical protein
MTLSIPGSRPTTIPSSSVMMRSSASGSEPRGKPTIAESVVRWTPRPQPPQTFRGTLVWNPQAATPRAASASVAVSHRRRSVAATKRA